jgi:hypothetical protein
MSSRGDFMTSASFQHSHKNIEAKRNCDGKAITDQATEVYGGVDV